MFDRISAIRSHGSKVALGAVVAAAIGRLLT